MTPSELYDGCNETELYQIARASGLAVLPSMSKTDLIRYIVGLDVPAPVAHDLDEWRLAIMRFVLEHRKQLEVQLQCPAKSMDPRACFQCVDHQVISCLVDNARDLELIRIHKKPIEPETMQGDAMPNNAQVLDPATILDATNAPRDKELLKAAGTYKLRKLAEDKALGPIVDPANKETQMDFGRLTIDQRVDRILKALLELDAKAGGHHGSNGSNGTNGTATAAAPTAVHTNGAPTAASPGASVASVDPVALKSAQDATQPGPSVPGAVKRAPKTGGPNGAAPEGDVGAVLAAVQVLINQAGTQASATAQGLTELRTLVEGIGTDLDAKVDAMYLAVQAALAEQTLLLKYGLNTLLTIAEERGVAGRGEILADAISNVGLLDAEIEASGKAK